MQHSMFHDSITPRDLRINLQHAFSYFLAPATSALSPEPVLPKWATTSPVSMSTKPRSPPLTRVKCPFTNPGLAELLHDNARHNRINFTTDAASGLTGAEAAFICVGTPMSDDGTADLRYVESAARDIGKRMADYTVVITKSTVPVGTADKVHAWVSDELAKRGADIPFDVASNPEFLKEGSAVDDFMRPDRVVIGVSSDRAEAILRDLYGPFIRNGLRIYTMDIRSAEMTKYAANSMLATKISFINEIANICEHVGADVRQVRQGVGADGRIGMQFLHPA